MDDFGQTMPHQPMQPEDGSDDQTVRRPATGEFDGGLTVPNQAIQADAEQDAVQPLTVGRPPVVDDGTVPPTPQPGIEQADAFYDEDEEYEEEDEGLFDMRILAVGCGLLGVFAFFILAGFLLFLPPANLAQRIAGCPRINTNNPVSTYEDGSTITLMGETATSACSRTISADNLLSGRGGSSFSGAAAALPAFLELRSPVYDIRADEEASVMVEIALPPVEDPLLLDAYAWNNETEEWEFVAGEVDTAAGVFRTTSARENIALFESRSITPLIGTIIASDHDVTTNEAALLNIVMPSGLNLRDDGAIDGQLVDGWDVNEGYLVVPVISATNADTLNRILNDEAERSRHAADLVNLAVIGSYGGVTIDYSAVSAENQIVFVSFLEDLASAMAAQDKLVAVILPEPVNNAGMWDTAGYDWTSIGNAADVVVLNPGPNPELYALDGPLEDLLTFAVGQVPRQKLSIAVGALSVQAQDGSYETISLGDAVDQLGGIELVSDGDVNAGENLAFQIGGGDANISADESTGAYRAETDGSTLWLVSANTVRLRLDLVSDFNVGGLVVLDLVDEGTAEGVPTAVNEFKVSSASSLPTMLELVWSIRQGDAEAANGTSPIDIPFNWQPGEEGEYSVSGSIAGQPVGDGVQVVVGGDGEGEAVADAPTPAPAPANPQPQPDNNDQPADEPTPAPAPAAAPAGVAGGDGGGFELGGQIPNQIAYTNEMNQAGMRWVKFQIKYGPGVDPALAGVFVGAGQAAGYKVLLSIPGDPYPDAIDFAGYTEFLRQVASYNPDAIEVWNEMNIAFEWPAGQINPTSYVNDMLAPAFNAIKSTSPNTMVIIGALAPTGAFGGGCGAQGCDDVPYVQGMAQAGAAQYANCLGVHHNSGTTSPSVRSGRPEGDHYSWYFLPTVEAYYNAMGGALPVCITELGYLSPEGYGTLPDNFAWASNTTVAQHAQWLGEAKDVSQSLGYVRMMIIFNVGFTTWTPTDPQAGFSIIRPDGSCPACASLGS